MLNSNGRSISKSKKYGTRWKYSIDKSSSMLRHWKLIILIVILMQE